MLVRFVILCLLGLCSFIRRRADCHQLELVPVFKTVGVSGRTHLQMLDECLAGGRKGGIWVPGQLGSNTVNVMSQMCLSLSPPVRGVPERTRPVPGLAAGVQGGSEGEDRGVGPHVPV